MRVNLQLKVKHDTQYRKHCKPIGQNGNNTLGENFIAEMSMVLVW